MALLCSAGFLYLLHGAEPFWRSSPVLNYSISPHFVEPPDLLPQSQVPELRLTVLLFRSMIGFYGEELLAPRPTPKLEDHPLAVHDCLFNLFAATLHTEGRSSFRNPSTRPAVVNGTHLCGASFAIDFCHSFPAMSPTFEKKWNGLRCIMFRHPGGKAL
jgi:hypothetical protein